MQDPENQLPKFLQRTNEQLLKVSAPYNKLPFQKCEKKLIIEGKKGDIHPLSLPPPPPAMWVRELILIWITSLYELNLKFIKDTKLTQFYVLIPFYFVLRES